MLELAFAITFYILFGLLTLIYGFVRTRLLYWRRRGVAHTAPKLIAGNLEGVGAMSHIRDVYRETYRDYKASGYAFCGFYYLLQPAAFVLDLNLANEILAHDRTQQRERDGIATLLAQLNDSEQPIVREWRNKLTPAPAGDSIEELWPSMLEVGEELTRRLAELYAQDWDVDVCELIARYSVDVLGACFYELDTNLLSNRDVTCELYNPPLFYGNKFSYASIQCIPPLCRLIQRRDVRAEILDFETAPIVLVFALHELAHNQDVQKRLRKEITEMLAQNKQALTLEMVKKLRYLDQVILETIRKHSIRPQLQRIAQQDFRTDTAGYVIQEGSLIIIPVDAIHHDAELFDEPHKFKPERFDAVTELAAWLPSLDEERNSFGVRFAQMQCRLGLIALLRDYGFCTCTQTTQHITYDNGLTLIAPKDGYLLCADKLTNEQTC